MEEQAEGVNRMVVSRHFPMNTFLLTVLNLAHSMVNRLSENHVILPPNDDRVLVWHQTRQRLSDHGSAAVARFSEVQVPSDESGEGPAEEAPDQGAQPWALSLPDKELCLREALAVCTPPAPEPSAERPGS